MYTRLWKLITKHMEENSRMAVFLTSAMLIWTIGITMAGILVCIIKHMNVICRLSDLICAGIYASLVMGAGYVLARRFLLYMMQKVYLFVLPKEEVSVWLILGLTAVNILLSMAAVAMPVRAVLKDSVVEEIRR